MLKTLLKKINLSYNHLLIIGLLLLIVSLNQYIIGNKSLEMGFFTDDWLFLSAYRTYVTNPILDIFNAWKNIGSHNFTHTYYIGIFYPLFGLDYSAYRIINLAFKILATLSLYPLVLIIFKRRLIAFLSTLIYSFHFSSFGMLDGPSRGQDFLAIASMNLFLLIYIYFLQKRLINTLILFGLAIMLAGTIFIDPTRMFPLIIVVLVIEAYFLLIHGSLNGLKTTSKHLLILLSPFILAIVFTPEAVIPQLTYSFATFQRLINGNWQLLLSPVASLGSTFIPRSFWLYLFGHLSYDSFLSYMSNLLNPLLLFLIFNLTIGILVIKKPFKFIFSTLKYNFIFGIMAFFLANHWLYINREIALPVDPGTYLTPALIGLFFLSIGLTFLKQWQLSNKKENLYLGVFSSLIFSLLFVFLTWIFADNNSIFLGVHAYLNIPSIGSSVFIALILTLIYDRLNSSKILSIKILAPQIIILLLGLFFYTSFVNVDQFFSKWLNEGVRSSDQRRIMDKFWSDVKFNKHSDKDIPPLIYLDGSEDHPNGSFYSEVIIWRVAAWFDLKYKKPKEGRYSLCDIAIINKEDILKHLHLSSDKTSLVYDKCGQAVSHKLDDFYAFKLKNRDLYPMRTEILKELGVE